MKIPSLRRGLRLLIALVFGSLAFFAVKAVDPAPASPVSNVTFAQRTDGSKLVDVRYTLTGGSSGIALAYSVDGGTTYSALSSVTGDVGATVSAGTSKQIVWNAGTEYPDSSSANVRFRVTPLLSGAGGSFAPIPGGTYQMGNLVGDADIADVGTVSVTLSPYYMAVHHTTKAQWDAVRTWAASHGYTDLAEGGGKAANHPVQTVTWYDVVKWTNAASEKDGLTPCFTVNGAVFRAGISDEVSCEWSASGYRLATEAEWEVSARGGLSAKRFPWGDTISQSQANYSARTSYGNVLAYDLSIKVNGFHPTYRTGDMPYTSPVGSFAANGYGLCDMAGNVYQWCWDSGLNAYPGGTDPRGAATGSSRVSRGGSWNRDANVTRSARRVALPLSQASYDLGFRLAKGRSDGAGSAAVSALGAIDTALLQPASPVSNVTFAQRTDGSNLVDVRYTLNSPASRVDLAVSVDGGTTFSATTTVLGDTGSISDKTVAALLADSNGDGTINYLEMRGGMDPSKLNSFDPLSLGLVAAYPFKGDFKDSTLNAGDAIPRNAVGFISDARFGQVAKVTGSGWGGSGGGHIEIPKPQLSEPNLFTASFWLREDGMSDSAGEGYLTNGYRGGSRMIAGHLWGAAYYTEGGLANGGTHGVKAVPAADVTGKWIHYTVVSSHANATATLYVNGEQSASVSLSGTPDGNWFIGRHWWSGGYEESTRLIAAVAGLRLYNRALSPSEVALLYQTESGSGVVSVGTSSQVRLSAGTGKHIVWNAGADMPNFVSSNVKVRVTALLDGAGGVFAPIPGGTYSMGNLIGDADVTNAGTVSVTLSPYYMAVNDTAKAQWDVVRSWAVSNGYTDLAAGGGKGANHPVHTVSWYDAVKWANAASEKEGLTPCYKANGAVFRTGTNDAVTCDWTVNGYRLPTEAEWEIAARGGLKGKRFPWGDTISHSQANYKASASYSYDLSGTVSDYHPTYKTGEAPYTSPVGSFAANGYGLYDVVGNVWQWCWDWYGSAYIGGQDPGGVGSGTYKLVKGGPCGYEAMDLRIAHRGISLPALAISRDGLLAPQGFRLARSRADNSGAAAFSALGALNTLPAAKIFQDITPQVTGLTGYSSASLREVANANGAAPYYLSTDGDVLKLYSQPAPFQFSDVSAKFLPAGFKFTPGSRLVVADFDNNGSQDLVLWEPAGLRVLLNTAGTFKEAPVPVALNQRLSEFQKTLVDLLAADLDGDGDLDLVFRYVAAGTSKPGRVACIYNDATRGADGRQSWAPNAAAFARVADVLSLSYGYGGIFAADLNLDGKVDLILGEKASTSVSDNYEQRPLHLFVNKGSGVLEETGTPLTGMADYGFAFADYQGTGRMDLIQGSSDWPWAGSYPHAYWSNESGVFEKSSAPVLERVSGDYHYVLNTADFDLDGRSDAFWSRLGRYFGGLSTGPLRLWRNTGPKAFQDVATEWGFTFTYPAGSGDYSATVADFDNDGAPDLLVNAAPWNGSIQRLYRNNAIKSGANYLKVRLTGVSSARDGTGARIEVRTGSNVAVRYNTGAEQSNLPFGLGSAKTADLVKVYWPSGKVSEAKNVPGNQWLEVVEPAASTFEVVRGSFTWPEALADAAKRGGRPAVLSTPELLRQGNALQAGPDAVSLWIGLSDEAVNGTFRWLDGTATTAFTNWSPYEPNDFFGVASENNVEMYPNGKWNDLPGTYRLPGYLLERTGGALRITKQPESVAVNFASPFTLSVTAEGAGNIAYQWFKDGTQVSGATSGSLTVSSLTRAGAGTYWVVVSEAGKSLTSEKALVTMANPPPVPTDSLLGWWPLDGNALDQGPNAIHGTLTGPTAGNDRFNRVTRALQFAGSSGALAYVDFGAADKLRVAGDSTVVLWVRFADSDTATPQILNFGTGQFEISTSAGRGARALQYTVGGVTIKGSRMLETGKWHHVAAVRKAGRGFLYVNGRLDAEGAMVAAPSYGQTLSLGRTLGDRARALRMRLLGYNVALPSPFEGAFAGAMDDLRIYGRALTSLEIEALGSQPDGGDILPPVVVQDPKSLVVDAGAAAQFAVRASGSRGVLYYQWLKDGVELPGATAAVLTLPKVEARHTGAYACVVSDGYAKVTSAAATLGVTGVNAGIWQGLVGHWKLDGNGQDSSGFNNHATKRGTPVAAADRFGVATGAFSFGGSGAYFEVGDRAAFDLNKSDATLSAWVKTSSAAESWLLSKMDPGSAGGIGIGAGTPATLSSQAVTYFKLSSALGYWAYRRILSVSPIRLVSGHTYEVTAVMPADFQWSPGDVFEFSYPASLLNPAFKDIVEALPGSSQKVRTVGDSKVFQYQFRSLVTGGDIHPQFAFWRPDRELVEIGNIVLRNLTTGELLTPPLDSQTLNTQWTWDSAEAVKYRTASVFAPFSEALSGFTMITGGSFQMGDNLDKDPSAPVRTVHVDTFHIAQTEVTGAQWRKVRDWGLKNGYTFLDLHNDEKDDLPAVAIKWYDAVKWCNALSEMEGRTPAYYVSAERNTQAVYRVGNLDLAIANVDWRGDGFRLPTEAEWEKAARGGLQGKRFPWGDEISQSNDNYYSTRSQSYDKSTAVGLPSGFSVEGNFWTGRFNPVKYFPPNGYGLYGMAGNINEWCFDGWRDVPTTAIGDASPVRVVRGSAAYGPQPGIPATDASAARVSSRSGRYAGLDHGWNFPGMRVVAGARKAETAQIPVATLAARTLLWGSTAPKAVRASDSGELGDNKWHLVTSVYDRKGKMTLYVDGAKRIETDITPADIEVSNEHPLLIGSAVGASSITGALDDVRWYNRALSAEDVLALYRQNEVLDTDGDGLSDAYEYGWGRYEIVPGSFTWAEAKAHAEAKGGHLATITSEAEWQAIKTVVGPAVTTTDLWLGGTDEGTEGQWRWVTGEKWNFAKWGRTLGNGQEPNGATGENVLNLLTAGYVDRPNGFIWNDWGNGNRCGYLFERGYFTDATKWDTDGDGVSDSEEIKNGTDPTNPDSGLAGSIYRFVPGSFSWTDAKADAEAKGGHLATITSAAEWGRVTAQIGADSEKPMWLGGYQPQDASSPSVGWKWVTGEEFAYTNWISTEPNGAGNMKGYLHANIRAQALVSIPSKNGGWYDCGDVVPAVYLPMEGYLLEIEPKVQNQYTYVSGRLTWREAKADAEKRGGHLGTIASAAEWETAAKQLGDSKTKIMWLGGYRESRSAGSAVGWKWVTDEPFSFTWWHFGEPNGDVGPDGVGYLMANHPTWKGGDWNDGPNNHIVEGYLLEIERTALQLNLAITAQPAPVTVPAIGGTASFSVTATGLAPLTYQWRKDGVALPGADQTTLNLKNIAPTHIGNYTVVVGDAAGKTVTSNEAALAITGVNSGIWSGLVAHYPFNGNANDESGSGLHGTILGGSLSTDRFGKASGYMFPAPGNKIRLPLDHTRFDADFTLSLWVNVPDFSNEYPYFASGENSYLNFSGSGPAYTAALRNKIGFYQNDLSQDTTKRVGDMASTSLMEFGKWVQLIMVRSGNTHTLYVNGAQDQTKTNTMSIRTSGDVMYLGGYYAANTEDFRLHGSLDDVRVYNRALSAAEVTALYNSEKAIPPVITKQPAGLRMPPGSSGVLRVEATSESALSYQWQKDGVDIISATAQELPLNTVTEALQGSYRVRVSNAAGAVFSDAVLVDVLDPVSNVTVYVAKNGNDTTGDGTQAKPFVTIGKAVKTAANGARILVGPGTYAERVEYAGKSLRIHSSEGPASTILQGASGNTVVYMDAAAANAELRGFKITGGTGKPSPSSYGFDYYGGGLHCATTALVSDCIFEANGKGTPRVNSATFGGAIYSAGGKLQVVNCLINDNFAWASGGASLTENGSIEFDRCTVFGNDASQFFGRQGGLAVANGGRMLVRNCIVWGNTGSQLGAFGWPYNVRTEIVVEYSDVQAPNDGGGAQTFRNGTGTISSDPLFADVAAKNFALRTGSPALDKAAPGLPKEKDGTAADMGWRADRFGGEVVTFGSALFVDVTDGVRLPEHELLAEIDGGQGLATDRLVRVADGTLQLWRVTGAFGYRDVTVAAGLPKDLLAPGFGGYYAVGDVDNNGAQDVVVWDATGLRVFLNTAGVFKAATVAPAVQDRAVALFANARGTFTLADLDSDGDLDVVFNYEGEGTSPGHIAQFTNGATLDGASGRRVWGAGDGFVGVQDVMTFPWQKPHFSVTDSNADGLPDLVVLETNGSWPSDTHTSHKAHVYLNNLGGTGARGGFGLSTLGDSSRVSFPHDSVMLTDKQVTIEAWVRGTSANASDNARIIRYSDGREHKELMVFGDGAVRAIYAWAPWPVVTAPAGSVKLDGLWHHVAFSRHLTGAWELYVDGKSVASGTGNGISDRIIGAAAETQIYTTGAIEIDEVRWSNVDRYNGPFTPMRRFETDANAVLLVHFDEGSGTRVQDSGIKRQVGTMPVGASWKPEGTKQTNGLARYSIVPGSYTFAEAQADAVARGGHLLTVSSAGEWQAVLDELTSRATSQDLWLGAEFESSQWSWVTGENFGYTNWDGGTPGSGTAGAYSAKDTGVWKTASAGLKLGYLLEWEPAFQEVEEAGLTDASEFSNFLSADVDGDGILDLVNGSSDWPSQSSPKVFYGNGDGTYRQEKAPFTGSDRFYHHVARVADIDLDGRMDGWWSGLHNFSDIQARLWRGLGNGAFAEVGTEWGVDVGLPSGNLFLSGYLSDWDGDGDLDLVARAGGSGGGRYKVYRSNAADRGGRWLRVRLVGVESPRDGTGARVTVLAGDRSETQYVGNVSSDGSPVATQLLFGLGSAPSASQVVVTWPNGQLQYLNGVPAGQVVEIRQNTVVPDWLKFTEQPQGRTVATGTLVVLSSTAVGSGTISYQWLKDGAAIAGGTASAYRIAAAALTSVGDYQVVATNGVSKVASAVARLEVAVPPSIVKQPAAISVVAGTDVAFAVDAIGTAPLSYQWLKGTTALTGQTAQTLTLKAVTAADVASYSVRVTNPAGSVTSTAAALALLTPVQITKQPANVTVAEGGAVALSVSATGSPVLKYQWYRDSNAIAGGTTASLAVARATALDAGSYSVTVSNPAGETSSTAALVAVNLLPRVLNVEENLSVKEGAAFELLADATGTGPLSYAWSRNGVAVAGGTAVTLKVSSAALSDSGSYSVTVKNAVGTAAAKVATVTVQALPRIVTQPAGIDAVEGSSALLAVAASGAQPLSYQWYKDGAVLEGSTSAVLSFNPLSAATHGGTYKVQVSNTVGRVFSDVAVVSARPVLRITTQPASEELALGTRGTFSVVASGAAPLSYQWYKDGATLPFATDDTLSVASVGKYSIGDYTVVVKDRFGNAVRSETAALTVAGEPSTYWKGLMAHWKFSGDTRDSTPFLNHGKGSNVQAVADRFGIANSALRFSGKLNPLAKPLVSQNVTVAQADSVQPSEKYTVVVWAKPEFAGENLGEVSPFMLGKRAGADLRDVSYAVGAGFGAGTLDRINGGGAQTGYVTGGTATLVDGQWQMYALTFDGGSLTLYRNGAKLLSQSAAASAVAPNAGPLRIGSGSGDGYQEWFGCLDDIRLYNKALNAQEVTALYAAENTPPQGAVAPAAIVVQPVGYKVPVGGAVTLRVEASGGAPLDYQWKRDGALLAGGTSAEYAIASAALPDEGSYTVEVSNSVASVTSVPAFVDVVPAVVADRLFVSKTGNDTTGTGASSAPFLTLTKAVQVARSGSQIQVGPGTYAERLEYRGKTLVIESTNGPLETVIQAPSGNTAVFIDAAALNSQLRGFKIAGGTGRALSATAASITFTGGGLCVLTSALVQDCIIEGNGNVDGIRFKSQASFGGGVYSTGGTTQLVNCLIIGNHASEAGGAVFTERGTCELDRCTVYGNTVGTFNAQIGGLAVRDAGRLVVRNSIVRGNTGQQIGAMPFPNNKATAVQIEYSAIEGGATASQVATLQTGAGNISSDPLFVDVVAKNFALRPGSPALDAAAPGLPKEADGTAADMGYRQDRGGKNTAQTQEALFTEVSGGSAAQLPEHSLVALVDAGAGAKVDRLVRVLNGKETVVRLWRAAGEFAATDVTAAAGLPLDLGSGLLAVGDFDNNGAQDVASWSAAGLRVYLSTAGVFKAQTVSAAIVAQARALWAQNAGDLEVADLNGDGLLDLVWNYTVDGTAQPGRIGAFLASGTADATGRRSWGTTGGFTEFREVQSYTWTKPVFSLADVNGDGLADLLVLETNGRAPEDTGSRRPAHVYLNRWKTNVASPFNELLNHGIVGGNELSKFQIVDVNGDGKLDLVNGSAAEGSVEAATPQWFEGAGDGTFTARTVAFTAGAEVGHRLFSEVDVDLDGVLDPVWLGADAIKNLQARLWRGKGAGAWQDMTAEWGVDAGLGAGRLHLDGYFSDWDGDGSLDLVVRAWDDASTQRLYKLYRNQAVARGGKVVRVRLEGVRSPRDGQGAVIELTAGGRKQVQYVGNLGEGYSVVKSFGLGAATAVEKITVRWPSGTVQDVTTFGSGAVVEVKETMVPVDSVVLLRAPQSVVASSGQAVSLACEAVGIGSGTMVYQWFKDGALLAGATKASYDIGAMTAANVGAYTVRLTFGTANVLTQPATVELAVAPTIVTQPESLVVLPGQTARFSVAVSGTSPFSYQWFKGGAAVVGATNSSLNVSDVGAVSAGAYTVKVTNGVGSVTSAVANLTLASAPAITAQPAGGVFKLGAALVLTPAYTGTAPLRYQWYKDGASISGATAANLTLTPVALSSAGAYTVTVTNAFGSADSAAAAVEVITPPSIAEQPVGVSVLLGQAFKLQVRAAVGGGQTFQWFKGTTAVAGATETEFTVGAAQLADAGSYFVKVTNSAGTVQSVTVAVTVSAPPSITVQPLSQQVKEGSAVTLSVVAQGSATLTYQWMKNGVYIAGATTASYLIKSAVTTDEGVYAVKVTNSVGNVQSADAALGVLLLPKITKQPQGMTVVVGDAVTLSVEASGSGVLSYQWRKAGALISGATGSSFTIPAVQTSDVGNYDVVVTSAQGSVTSAVAVLSANVPVTISTHPVSRTGNFGTSTTFSVVAAGTGPLTYQWRKGGVTIPGATAASYSIASLKDSDAGDYDVVVTNRVGSLTSGVANLVVNLPVLITNQPAGVVVNPGSAVNLRVTAAGAAPITYQWKKNGVSIVGATADTYSIASAQALDAAQYTVVVTNMVGSVTSAAAVVGVNTPVSITTQPLGATINPGAPVTLKVVAAGTAPVTYQWRKGGVNIQGATGASYVIAASAASDAGSYDVVVTNVVNSVTSTAAVLSVNTPLLIATQPTGATVNAAASVSFTVVVTGTAPITYQWRKAGVAIAGATSATYTIPSVLSTSAGLYDVVVSNAVGSVTSNQVTLAVNSPVVITVQPLAKTVNPGASVSLSVTATGTDPKTYQWRKNNVAISGATASTYNISSVQLSDVGSYSVVVSNIVGSVTSSSAAVDVNRPLVITTQPQSVSVNPAAAAALSVVATGSAPMTYQWRKGGVAISGATSSTFSIPSAQAANAGSYDVVITNAVGSVTSNIATISLNTPIVITAQPAGGTVITGAAYTLRVTATGTAPIAYQWYKGTAAIPGATSASYDIKSASASDVGSYTVNVSNMVNSVTSSAAAIAVSGPPAIITDPVATKLIGGVAGALSARVYSMASFTYKWKKNGTDLVVSPGLGPVSGTVAGGLTASTVSLNFLSPDEQSEGSYSLSVTNTDGTKESASAAVTVDFPYPKFLEVVLLKLAKTVDLRALPSITSSGSAVTVTGPQLTEVASNETLKVNVKATGAVTYQWSYVTLKPGFSKVLTGQTSDTLDFTASGVFQGPGIYTCTATAGGKSTSLKLTISPFAPALAATTLEILTQPKSVTVSSGGSVLLNVGVSTGVWNYTWFKRGVNGGPDTVVGVSGSYLSLNSVQAAEAGTYFLVVTDQNGNSVVSETVTVSVLPSAD